MRILVALLFTASMSYPAELRIDHVTIAGKSLAALNVQLASTDLKTEPGGPHTNHATEMSIASFSDGSYIEAIAIQSNPDPQNLAQHPWAKYLNGDAGPCAFAVRPKDFTAEVARIRAQGVPVKVESSGRTRPDGVPLSWETADIGTDAKGSFYPFLIHDTSPRDKRAYPTGKPSNKEESGVLRVIIAVRKLSDATDRYHLVYPDIGKPLRQVDKQFGAELAWLPDTPIIFAQPLSASSWIADRIEKSGEGPCAFVLAAKKTSNRAWFLENRWFGRDLKWFDPEKLGEWWLGIEVQ